MICAFRDKAVPGVDARKPNKLGFSSEVSSFEQKVRKVEGGCGKIWSWGPKDQTSNVCVFPLTKVLDLPERQFLAKIELTCRLIGTIGCLQHWFSCFPKGPQDSWPSRWRAYWFPAHPYNICPVLPIYVHAQMTYFESSTKHSSGLSGSVG